MARTISPHDLKARIRSDDELAVLDLREEPAFAESHLFHARNLPLGSLEQQAPILVPRLGVAVVGMDAGTGGESLALRGAGALAGLGYGNVAILDGGVESWGTTGFELFSGTGVPSKAFGEYVGLLEAIVKEAKQPRKPKKPRRKRSTIHA